MLVSFSLKNFASVKDEQTLSLIANNGIKHLAPYYVTEVAGLSLLKFIFLYGANASGKTTILKAIEFLRNLVISPNATKIEPLNFEPYLLNDYSRNENSEFKIEFICNDTRYQYAIEFNKQYIASETLTKGTRGKVLASRTTDAEKQLSTISFHKELKINAAHQQVLNANTLWNTTMLSSFLKTNIDIPEFKTVTDFFSDYLSPLITPQIDLTGFITSQIDKATIKKELLVQIMKQADFFISDIKIKVERKEIPAELLSLISKDKNLPEEIRQELQKDSKVNTVDMHFEHNNEDGESYPLPFDSESLGTKRFYGLAGILYLMLKSPSLFPIDELEQSLHPDLFKFFVLMMLHNAKNSQCIVTTHNREILDDKDLFRNDAIWITDKSESCQAELYSLADFDSTVIRNTSNILNAYKAGRLGGLPNIGDFYINVDEL